MSSRRTATSQDSGRKSYGRNRQLAEMKQVYAELGFPIGKDASSDEAVVREHDYFTQISLKLMEAQNNKLAQENQRLLQALIEKAGYDYTKEVYFEANDRGGQASGNVPLPQALASRMDGLPAKSYSQRSGDDKPGKKLVGRSQSRRAELLKILERGTLRARNAAHTRDDDDVEPAKKKKAKKTVRRSAN